MNEQMRRLSPKQPRARRAIKQVELAMSSRAAKYAEARNAENRRTELSLSALIHPLEKVIASDSRGGAALGKLRKQRFDAVAPLIRRAPSKSRVSSSTLSLALSEHITFATPPYDFEWSWGNAQQSLPNKGTGRIAVFGASGAVSGGSDDEVAAAAGIGVVLTTDRSVSVSVRPYIEISWAYAVGASGVGSNGSARGGVDAAAFLNGKIVSGVRRTTEFSDSRGWSGTSSDSGNGVAWVPDLELSFVMNSGVAYIVNFGAWVECDHTSGIGVGAGTGKLDGLVKWIVFERS